MKGLDGGQTVQMTLSISEQDPQLIRNDCLARQTCYPAPDYGAQESPGSSVWGQFSSV